MAAVAVVVEEDEDGSAVSAVALYGLAVGGGWLVEVAAGEEVGDEDVGMEKGSRPANDEVDTADAGIVSFLLLFFCFFPF